MKCFKTIHENISLLCAHVAAKMRDDLLTGTEHSYKVTPQCLTPQQQFIVENGRKKLGDRALSTIIVKILEEKCKD